MSGEIIEGYCDDLEKVLRDIIKAARPFVVDDSLVDELTGTIPFTDALELAIEQAEEILKQNLAE